MLATRALQLAAAAAAAAGLTYSLAHKNALTGLAKVASLVRKEKATKEIAEIFLCLFPQIADKIQLTGSTKVVVCQKKKRESGEPTEKPRLKLQKRINRRCFTPCWRVSSRIRRRRRRAASATSRPG